MTFKELQRIVKFAKKSGIVKLKVDGVELEFTHEALVTRSRKPSKEAAFDPTAQYTDEQMLFWSTANADNIEAN